MGNQLKGNSKRLEKARESKRREAKEILSAVGFAERQSNDAAIYSLLALLRLDPIQPWKEASAPLMGITPIIEFVSNAYGLTYAPNSRETIRDEAVKHFLMAGLVVRNPDNPSRPTNSGKTVYQIEESALDLIRSFGALDWEAKLKSYLSGVQLIKNEIARTRTISRTAVVLPSGEQMTLSPGGQNPLIKSIIEEFCPRFTPGGKVLYVGDSESKFQFYERDYLAGINIVLDSAEKMPDVIIHHLLPNWLVLIEAVTTAGPIDGKRRLELKNMFNASGCGLVYVTAFSNRASLRSFLTQISWETEVWVADSPDHIIHFNGERFLGPYSE